MPASFDLLRERLLQGGVRPRHARRYLAELKDHLEDLVAEERQGARGEGDARSRALARLGSVDALAGAMIARRELRAWSSKAPAVAYLITPSLALALGIMRAVATVVTTCIWLRGSARVPSDLPGWTRPLAESATFFGNGVLPVLLGWGLAAAAIRQRTHPLWPILGIVILAVVGAVLQVHLTLPSASGRGEVSFVTGGETFAWWVSATGRAALTLVLAMTPYAGLRLLRSAQAGGEGDAT